MSLVSTPLMDFANSTWLPLAGLNQLTIVQDNGAGAGQRSSSYTAAQKKLELQNSLLPPPCQQRATRRRRPRSTRRQGDDESTATAVAVLPPSPPRSKRVPRRSRWESRPSNENLLNKKNKPTIVGSPQQPKRQSTLELDGPLPSLPKSPPRQPQRQLSPLNIQNGCQKTYKLRQHTVSAHTA